MAPMNQDELKQMLDRLYGDQKRSMLRISSDEKIPAATIDADSAGAQNTPPVNMTKSHSGGDPMAKMTVEEVDELSFAAKKSRRRTEIASHGASDRRDDGGRGRAAPIGKLESENSASEPRGDLRVVNRRRLVLSQVAAHPCNAFPAGEVVRVH